MPVLQGGRGEGRRSNGGARRDIRVLRRHGRNPSCAARHRPGAERGPGTIPGHRRLVYVRLLERHQDGFMLQRCTGALVYRKRYNQLAFLVSRSDVYNMTGTPET